MIQIHELKCGNILNYDTAEGEILPTVIDWQDLKWLTEDPKGFNLVHSPIPITPEILEKAGFIFNETIDHWVKNWGQNGMEFIKYDSFYNGWALQLGQHKYKIFYFVHQLQNLIHALTGEELNIEL